MTQAGCPVCGCLGYLGTYRRKMEVVTTHVDAQSPMSSQKLLGESRMAITIINKGDALTTAASQ